MNPAAGLNFGLGGAKYMLFVGTVYPVSVWPIVFNPSIYPAVAT